MDETIEMCPHCDAENRYEGLAEDRMTAECKSCGKVIPLCDRCAAMHPNAEERPCSDCIFCDLANYMNCLRGKTTVEKFLAALNPPLTDMTTGLPEGGESTLQNYLDDAYGDAVNWDVKYWDIYRSVSECFLTKSSSEADCLDFVKDIVRRNKEG